MQDILETLAGAAALTLAMGGIYAWTVIGWAVTL